MKARILFIAAAMALFALQSCSSDDDSTKNVPVAVEAVFAQKYPQATVSKWEKKAGCYVAEYRNDQAEAEAWFTTDGTWIMTETDYLGTLPTAVNKYITKNYPTATIDDTDWIETPTDSYFKVELDLPSDKDIDLYIRKDGTMLRAVGEGQAVTASDTVKQAFAQKYPGITVRKWEQKINYYVAEFDSNGSEAEAWFTADGTWYQTVTDYHGTLPEAVSERIAADYPSATIDDIDLISISEGEYYEIELEQRGGEDITIYILADGRMLV